MSLDPIIAVWLLSLRFEFANAQPILGYPYSASLSQVCSSSTSNEWEILHGRKEKEEEVN